MSVSDGTQPKRGAERGGEHQNLRRMSLALDALAASPRGLRLAEIVTATRLGKTTTHRLMAGLVEFGWVDFLAEEGCYVLGFRPLTLALAATDRYDLSRLSAPALQAVADLTGDTVYLSLRSGMESVCVGRFEGDFPVKTLTLSVGGRRPLGVGAGSLALLAFQTQAAAQRAVAQTTEARMRYQMSDATLIALIDDARQRGYALNDGLLVSGMSAVGLPIRTPSGQLVAAISVAALSSRLAEGRRQVVVDHLQNAATAIEADLRVPLEMISRGVE